MEELELQRKISTLESEIKDLEYKIKKKSSELDLLKREDLKELNAKYLGKNWRFMSTGEDVYVHQVKEVRLSPSGKVELTARHVIADQYMRIGNSYTSYTINSTALIREGSYEKELGEEEFVEAVEKFLGHRVEGILGELKRKGA